MRIIYVCLLLLLAACEKEELVTNQPEIQVLKSDEMNKVLNAYGGFTAQAIKDRAEIPIQPYMTVVGNTVECVTIPISVIKGILASSSTSVGGLCTSPNVNQWSGFGPREWYVSSGALLDRAKTPYSMGNFAGYNHDAMPANIYNNLEYISGNQISYWAQQYTKTYYGLFNPKEVNFMLVEDVDGNLIQDFGGVFAEYSIDGGLNKTTAYFDYIFAISNSEYPFSFPVSVNHPNNYTLNIAWGLWKQAGDEKYKVAYGPSSLAVIIKAVGVFQYLTGEYSNNQITVRAFDVDSIQVYSVFDYQMSIDNGDYTPVPPASGTTPFTLIYTPPASGTQLVKILAKEVSSNTTQELTLIFSDGVIL